jgi:signal recognition particle subunit SRP54
LSRSKSRDKIVSEEKELFENLTSKLVNVFDRLSNKGRLTEKDVDDALKEVRIALLEADVNFKLVREFISKVREGCVGEGLLSGVNPGAQVVKVVNDEMVSILKSGNHEFHLGDKTPAVVLLVGLQGSGKTTSAGKLALRLRQASSQGSLLVPADIQRPAAIEQLALIGSQINIPVYREENPISPLAICANGFSRAKELGVPWVIMDTAGRLNIDDEMMEELVDIKATVSPHEILLVVDAMTGQEAVRVAEEFHNRIGLTGIVLTKLDGDARGGAALSISSVTGVPIKFVGIGEKLDALEPFYPDRIASRILGMGDVLTLVERAQSVVDEKKAREMEKKIRSASFDLQDMLDQLEAVQKMGPISQILEMVPGFSKIKPNVSNVDMEDGRLRRAGAIVSSMTPRERRNPDILNGSRKRRIAIGSGMAVQDVNQLINQHRQMKKFLKQATGRPGKMKFPSL